MEGGSSVRTPARLQQVNSIEVKEIDSHKDEIATASEEASTDMSNVL